MLTLASLISYNRRRPGEVQAISLWLAHIQFFICSFRCGKFVPVIVPAYIKPLLEFITDSVVLHTAGISTSNYVFANNRSGVIRGGYAMVVMTNEAPLTKPERIRGTNMRRFMATMSQGLNISAQQQRWVVDHMGHTLDVHNIHYKSTLDVIERVDISKLLLMMDLGQIGHFKGKRLDEIQFEELLGQTQSGATSEASERQDDEAEQEEDYLPELPEEDEESLLIFDHTKKRKRRTSKPRHKWTHEEIDELKQLFDIYFRKDKTAGEKAVKKAMERSREREGTVWQLPLKSIKSKVSWLRLHKK
ncbi:putative proteoglycan 4-like [Apostichopus japonicus]|uniref:Putative proteoglycan 4-like n=1 Tax=Stichopus japonicus TaxID=307972 RepID=A0A2G8KKA8_STIJA|nr:putative proteoglycan 4-like [Apostichopus japonicus]